MLNYIWAGMIFIGIIYGSFTGNMKEITEAALQSAGEAVSLCISMAGIMAFWVGLMEVAQASGLIAGLTKVLSPFVTFMFPDIPKSHKARDYISTNIIANILGWAGHVHRQGLWRWRNLLSWRQKEELRHFMRQVHRERICLRKAV